MTSWNRLAALVIFALFSPPSFSQERVEEEAVVKNKFQSVKGIGLKQAFQRYEGPLHLEGRIISFMMNPAAIERARLRSYHILTLGLKATRYESTEDYELILRVLQLLEHSNKNDQRFVELVRKAEEYSTDIPNHKQELQRK